MEVARIERGRRPVTATRRGVNLVLIGLIAGLIAAGSVAADEFDRAMVRRREELKDRVPLRELVPGIRHLRPMDALRIYLGAALFIKGIYFIMNMAVLEASINLDKGITAEMSVGEVMIAWSVVFAHIIGGASLMLGFVTRVASAANAVVLFGAVIYSFAGATAGGSVIANVDFQFTTFVFFTLVLFVWRGSGPLSLDHLVRLDAESEPEIL